MSELIESEQEKNMSKLWKILIHFKLNDKECISLKRNIFLVNFREREALN
jgi:hypothetical protein